MERRSRSQTRRAGDLPQPLSLPYSRPPEQARTLSPDRRERYRASYRDSLPHQPPSSVPHSNSNSYNQYNHPYPLNHQAPRQPYSNNNVPPRPEPPTYTASQPSVSPNKPANNLPADKQVKYDLLEQCSSYRGCGCHMLSSHPMLTECLNIPLDWSVLSGASRTCLL